MARYNRINLDGKSKSMTAVVKAGTQYGSIVSLDADGEFVSPTELSQSFVLGGDYQQGQYTDESLLAGQTGVAEYLDSGRKLAVLTVAGDYEVGSALKEDGGMLALATTGDTIIGYSSEAVTLSEDSLLAVSIK